MSEYDGIPKYIQNHDGVMAELHIRGGDSILSDLEKLSLMPTLSPTQVEALVQLTTPVWDGNLMSKTARSELCDLGLVARYEGLNFCTQDGYCVLHTLGLLGDDTKFIGGLPWKSYTRSAK